MANNATASSLDASPNLQQRLFYISRRYQSIIDSWTPFTLQRWLTTLALLCLYILRIYFVGGFYVVTYALSIYLLNVLLAFLTPKYDMSSKDDVGVDNQADLNDDSHIDLGQREDEFKPFVRQLPEMTAWYLSTRAFVIALICTLFEACDVPVFWPILLFYFFFLFVFTMRRQIKHMMKYKYVPFDIGKKKYRGSK